MNQQQLQQLEQQRKVWNLYSAGWKKWDERMTKGTHPVTQKLIEILNLKGDECVLDVASGPGEPGLARTILGSVFGYCRPRYGSTERCTGWCNRRREANYSYKSLQIFQRWASAVSVENHFGFRN